MIVTKTVVHVAEMRAEKAYADRDPYVVAGVELGGVILPVSHNEHRNPAVGTFAGPSPLRHMNMLYSGNTDQKLL